MSVRPALSGFWKNTYGLLCSKPTPGAQPWRAAQAGSVGGGKGMGTFPQGIHPLLPLPVGLSVVAHCLQASECPTPPFPGSGKTLLGSWVPSPHQVHSPGGLDVATVGAVYSFLFLLSSPPVSAGVFFCLPFWFSLPFSDLRSPVYCRYTPPLSHTHWNQFPLAHCAALTALATACTWAKPFSEYIYMFYKCIVYVYVNVYMYMYTCI